MKESSEMWRAKPQHETEFILKYIYIYMYEPLTLFSYEGQLWLVHNRGIKTRKSQSDASWLKKEEYPIFAFFFISKITKLIAKYSTVYLS